MARKGTFRRVRNPALKVTETATNVMRELHSISNIKPFKDLFERKCRNPIFKGFFFNKPSYYVNGFRRDMPNFCLNLLEKDIFLLSEQIIKYKDEINAYVIHREQIEKFILLGELESALIILEEVRKYSGLSFWYLGIKFSILSTLDRDEDVLSLHSELFDSVKTGVEERDLDILMAACMKKAPTERCDFMIDAIAEGLNYSAESRAIEFLFRFSPLKFEESDFLSVCEYLGKANVIDKYNALYRMASISLAKQELDHISLSTYLELAPDVVDNRLNVIRSIINEEKSETEKDKALGDICDTYIKGKYSEVIKKAEHYLSIWPELANIYEFYVNSLYNLNQKPKLNKQGLLFRVIDEMLNYLASRGAQTSSKLTKILYQYNQIDCLQIINLVDIKTDICHKEIEILYIYRYLDIFGSYMNPFRNIKVESSSVSYQLANSNIEKIDNLPIPEYRKIKWKADKSYHAEEYGVALDYYIQMHDIPKHLFDEINAKIALSMLKDGDVDKTVSFISDLYFQNKQNLWKLPKSVIFDEIDDADDINFKNIDLTITIFLILKDEYSEHQTISLFLKDYLASRDVTFPSEFIPKNDKEIFILEQVCNLTILEGLRIFNSDNDNILERVMILSLLLENVGKKDTLLEEFEFLVHQYTKNSSIIKLGKGKLRVDQARVFSLAKQNFQKLFEELNDALTDEENNSSQYKEHVLIDKFDNRSIRTNKDSFNLANRLLLEVRDIYTLNPTFGLDNSLNLDIRHNCIVPVLRAVFDKHDLICRRVDSNYLDNVFIEENFKAGIVRSYYDQIQNAFKDFSKRIDGHLTLLKTQYMQIGTNDRVFSKSLFKFFFTTDEVNALLELTKSDSTYEEIIWWIISILDQKTEESIKTGKVSLNTAVPAVFDEYLKLIKDISNLVGKSSHRITDRVALFRTDIIEKVKELSSWLDLEKSSGEHFYINIPILEALNFVEKMFPKVNVKLRQPSEVETYFNGIHLSSFIRIFIILFENAVKRRNAEKSCNISIEWHETETETEIIIKSKSNDIDLKKVEELNETVNNIDYLDKANRENNSGFFKIKRILEKDLNVYNTILLKPKNNNFIVSMKFSHEKIIFREESNENIDS